MGHNFLLKVKVSLGYDENSLQKALSSLHDWLDHTYINELKEFNDQALTYEILAKTVYKKVKSILLDDLQSILFTVTDKESIKVDGDEKVMVIKNYKINCVHRHHNPDLTMAQNKQLYGKCSGIHGHEYKMEVGVSGPLDSYGRVLDWDELDNIVQQRLITKYDKSYLNEIMGNTSGELITELFFKDLSQDIRAPQSLALTVRETKKNSFFKV